MGVLEPLKESVGDMGMASKERDTLLVTDPDLLRADVAEQLRELPESGDGAGATLDYGDDMDRMALSAGALTSVINASRERNEEATTHVEAIAKGLYPGPGPSLRVALTNANAAFPTALRSHLEQWSRMCADILLFKDAATTADEKSARNLSPTAVGELR